MKKKSLKEKIPAWKVILAALFVIAVISAIAAQILINIENDRKLKSVTAWQTRSLFIDGMDRIYDISMPISKDGTIEDLNLKLDPSLLFPSDRLTYIHYEDEEYGDSIQLMSYYNHTYGTSSIYGNDIETVMNDMQEANACVQGITVSFNSESPNEGNEQVGSKVLDDGRTIHIFKKPGCNSPDIATLEQIAFTIQSN